MDDPAGLLGRDDPRGPDSRPGRLRAPDHGGGVHRRGRHAQRIRRRHRGHHASGTTSRGAATTQRAQLAPRPRRHHAGHPHGLSARALFPGAEPAAGSDGHRPDVLHQRVPDGAGRPASSRAGIPHAGNDRRHARHPHAPRDAGRRPARASLLGAGAGHRVGRRRDHHDDPSLPSRVLRPAPAQRPGPCAALQPPHTRVTPRLDCVPGRGLRRGGPAPESGRGGRLLTGLDDRVQSDREGHDGPLGRHSDALQRRPGRSPGAAPVLPQPLRDHLPCDPPRGGRSRPGEPRSRGGAARRKVGRRRRPNGAPRTCTPARVP